MTAAHAPLDFRAGDVRDLTAFVSHDQGGTHRLHLLVDGAHCANCIARIERSLTTNSNIRTARLNLATGRLLIEWDGRPEQGSEFAAQVEALGYKVAPFDLTGRDQADKDYERGLIRSLAVAGFGAANIMLMSVAMWAGAAEDDAARALFHLFAAVIAVPVVGYAGMPFFTSAVRALRSGATNMDVPISLAVILAVGLSLVQIMQGAAHVWFESATMLLFFLLIGRLLDARARGQARGVVSKLLALRTEDAHVLQPDGTVKVLPADSVEPGMAVIVPPGAKVPVDGTITKGWSEFDTSLITGERVPAKAQAGDIIHAGTVNLGPPVTIKVQAVRDDTLVAEITRLMETAEQKRGRVVLLADRIARLYVPVVHILALAAFLYWGFVAPVGMTRALEITIAVLVITCPCALALAVPVVQVLASTRLMKAGVLIKSPTALERLAQVDHVTFDKTGTLTEPMLVPDLTALSEQEREIAGSLAAVSHHPLARSLTAALPSARPDLSAREVPGAGVVVNKGTWEVRLGRLEWVAEIVSNAAECLDDDDSPALWLGGPEWPPVRISFMDHLRPDAQITIQTLKDRGVSVDILSGDRGQVVAGIADRLGVEDYQSDVRPADKVTALEGRRAAGRHVLMVGDGLNDGPALSAAHVSMSPSSGSDLAQVAADAVFQSKSLSAVLVALGVAGQTGVLSRQNIGFALIYNAVAVPAALMGFVTPLVAAIAMSASSLIVTLNAFRIVMGRYEGERGDTP